MGWNETKRNKIKKNSNRALLFLMLLLLPWSPGSLVLLEVMSAGLCGIDHFVKRPALLIFLPFSTFPLVSCMNICILLSKMKFNYMNVRILNIFTFISGVMVWFRTTNAIFRYQKWIVIGTARTRNHAAVNFCICRPTLQDYFDSEADSLIRHLLQKLNY